MIRSFINKKNINWKIILFPLIICMYLFLMLPFLSTIRPVICDEAWYASTGYNFSIGNGFRNTIVGSGGNANFMLPLFIGISFKILGVSLFAARIVAVFCGVAFLLILRRIFKMFQLREMCQLVAFLTVLFVPFFNSVFRYARPECLTMVFLLAAIYFYLKFLKDENYFSVVLIAFFLMLAFLSHPFSSLFFLLIGVHLIIISKQNKDKKLFGYIAIFGIIGLISLSILFWINSYYNQKNTHDLIQSINSILVRTSASEESKELLINRVNVFFRSWFISSKIIFVGPLVLTVIFGFFIPNKQIRGLSLLAFSYIIISFFIFKNDLSMFPYVFNYFLVISIVILPFVFNYFLQYFYKFTILLTACFLSLNLVFMTIHNFSKYEKTNIEIRNDLKKIIPQNSTVFGAIEFWFAVPSTKYISNMYRLDLPNMDTMDYIIINHIPTYLDLKRNNKSFSLIYTKDSKQYGKISVFKRNVKK